MKAYWRQLEMGKHFLHEHPNPASSWKMPEVEELANDPRVYVVKGPMCRWDMIQEDRKGIGHIRKETRWMTSSPVLARILEGRCPNNDPNGIWH